MIEDLGLEADDAYLYLRFVGARYRICRTSGQVDRAEEDGWNGKAGFEEVMSIYDLLCNPNGSPVLSGRWQSVQDMNRLRSGAKPWAAA